MAQPEEYADPSPERVARNDSLFREANEKIRESARAAGEPEWRVPFICECAWETCTEILPLTLDRYERIRANGRLFVNAPGHEESAGPHARVVERADGFVVVEKVGEAGEIVEELDPRAETS